MNLEQSLALIVVGIGLCALAGVIANWWSHRDTVKQIADWENELVDRELAVQTERIQAQLARSEAQMLRTETVMLREDAEKRYAEASELVRVARRQLYQASAEAIELDDEMADTQLIDVITDDTIVRKVVQ